MHIVIISYDFCLEAGGIQNTSYLLAQELSKEADVTCFSPLGSHEINEGTICDIKSSHNQWSLQKFTIPVIKEIYSLHKAKKIDYILCTTYFMSYNVLPLSMAYNIPYGIMTHGNEVMPFRGSFVRNNINALRRFFVLRFAKDIFANSRYTQNLVNNICKYSKCKLVPPPIDLIPESKCYNYKRDVLFSIGRIVERKGFHLVLKALPRVLKTYPTIKYIIAGDGDYLNELENIVTSLSLQENVKFVGKISEEEKMHYLRECGLFIMPSYVIKNERQVEGFGLVYLEANNYGKFVIGSNSGGVPDAINEPSTGFIVNEDCVEAVEDAILKFYDPNFKYNPEDCIRWTGKHHISKIGKLYLDEIISKS